MSSGAIVTDARVLKAMVRRGFIVWNQHATDRHWTGATVRRIWVQPGEALENWYDIFAYKGVRYRLRYVDGCFHPFVHRMDREAPAFV